MSKFKISVQLEETNENLELCPTISYWNSAEEIRQEIDSAPQVIASRIRTLIKKELSLEHRSPYSKLANITVCVITNDDKEVPISENIIRMI